MNQKGFTFIETLMTLAIFIFALIAVTGIIAQIYRTYNYTFQQSAAINSARRGVETMLKEIREAQTGDNGSYMIESASDFEFIFYGDIDKDASVERIRYFLDGANFKKSVIDPTGYPIQYLAENEVISTLSEYVRNDELPIFTYYNGDYPADTINNPLPTPSRLKETKLMRVYLKINANPARSPKYFELESNVQIRNLKVNL